MTDADAILDALAGAIRHREGVAHEAALAELSGLYLPTIEGQEEERLHRFVSDEHAAVALLLEEDDDGLRHLAAFALGFSRSAASVEPLIRLLVAQKDPFDHDYAYVALGRLGDVALEPLYRIAADDGGERAAQALQALGQSDADPLPWLRRLARVEPMPPGLMTAYENAGDPAGLPDIEPALWHRHPQTRNDALFTAWCLLELAWESSHDVLEQIDRLGWGDRMAELLEDEELEEPELALSCLGYLRDQRHMGLLLDALEDEEMAHDAVMALGCYRSEPARRRLEELLEKGDLPLACEAGCQLQRDPHTPDAVAARARQVMLRGLVELDADHAWCNAARALPGSDSGRRLLFDCVAGDDTVARTKALDALSFYVASTRSLDTLLADCPSGVARAVREAVETSSTRLEGGPTRS